MSIWATLSLESKDRQEIPLAEEMAFLEHYMAIQKIRFGDHLRIETQIAPEVKYASVPCLFVQPLVENAVQHGTPRRASGGTVIVSAQRVSAAPPRILPLDRLVVKSGGSIRFVRVADIDWIEAAGVYANLHIGGKELLYRAALNELAERLDPLRFVRVHRSAVVNIESILHLEPISHGEFEVVLKNGSRPRISRTYRTQLEKRLGQSL